MLNRQHSAVQQTTFSCSTDNIQLLNRQHSAAQQTPMVKRKLFIHASTSADAWMKVTSGIAEYFTPGVSDDIQLQTQHKFFTLMKNSTYVIIILRFKRQFSSLQIFTKMKGRL